MKVSVLLTGGRERIFDPADHAILANHTYIGQNIVFKSQQSNRSFLRRFVAKILPDQPVKSNYKAAFFFKKYAEMCMLMFYPCVKILISTKT
jgi:hypothetical protein